MAELHSEPVKTNAALLAVVWLVVLVPTGWGLSYTIQNAMKIFTAPATAPAATAPATTTPASGSPVAKP